MLTPTQIEKLERDLRDAQDIERDTVLASDRAQQRLETATKRRLGLNAELIAARMQRGLFTGARATVVGDTLVIDASGPDGRQVIEALVEGLMAPILRIGQGDQERDHLLEERTP